VPTSNESWGRIFSKNGKLALRSGILFASPEVMHRPPFDSSLYLDERKLQQIRTETWNTSARRLLAATMPERCPRVCRAKIMFNLLTDNFFRLHNDEHDEMPCKLDSTAYVRSFRTRPNPTLIYRFISQRCADDSSRARLAWAPWFSHCNTLQRIALPALQHTAAHCNTLQHIATHRHTLPHSATHCNTLQLTAAHFKTGLVHKDSPCEVGLEQLNDSSARYVLYAYENTYAYENMYRIEYVSYEKMYRMRKCISYLKSLPANMDADC